MNVIAVIAARMGSTRFPGKVMLPLGTTAGGDNMPVLASVVNAAKHAPGVHQVCVATSRLPRDNVIVEWCIANDITFYRGSETDVLARFTDAASLMKADAIVRLTGDCPFADPLVIGATVALFRRHHLDYAQNVSPATWPDGLDCEVIHCHALKQACNEATRPSDRDTVTQYIERNRQHWHSEALICPIPSLHQERWVLDTEDDYKFCQAVVDRIGMPRSYLDILELLDREPELRNINNRGTRNERFLEAVAKESPIRS